MGNLKKLSWVTAGIVHTNPSPLLYKGNCGKIIFCQSTKWGGPDCFKNSILNSGFYYLSNHLGLHFTWLQVY